ncbi:MAG: hypothetical protein AB7V27_09555 [Candidatus Binatia bacterium]
MHSARPLAFAIAYLTVLTGSSARAEDCQTEFSSTFDAIQRVIFENRGCTSMNCHDAAESGGLDLRAGNSYQELVGADPNGVDSETVEKWDRILKGEKDRSLLYINVADGAGQNGYDAPLNPMPAGGLPPLSADELTALGKWIEAGAPREGTVPGTADLLDACLPPPQPIEIDPLPPPAPGTGVQLHMPRWILPQHSETEVCFASYYDVTDQVPAESQGPNGTFRYKRQQVRQDPLSHHLIVNLYTGSHGLDDPLWGTFKCRGGPKHGEVCDPQALGFCGSSAEAGQGECANEPLKSIACFGQSNLPPDAGTGLNSNGFAGTQETAATFEYGEGVYAEIPMRGVIIWNSHAFNLTDQDAKLEAWLNFEFAGSDEQVYPLRGIFNTNEIFSMNVPPFQAREICAVHVLPAYAHLTDLSSHMHQRGKRFRTFEGAWRCAGGERAGQACSPYGPDLVYETPDLCPGSVCESANTPEGGDCDGDFVVTVSELVRGVNIALGMADVSACARADINEDDAVTVDEIIKGVTSANAPRLRDPDDSLLYTSLVYNDPVTRPFAPPMVMGGGQSQPEERSLTYCALYDNGFANPDEVKRQSTSPPTPVGIPGVFGGPCARPTACTAGKVGASCAGNTDAQRDASCDTEEGAADGDCDACPLLGGVTTEDEMFILVGNYYVKQ